MNKRCQKIHEYIFYHILDFSYFFMFFLYFLMFFLVDPSKFKHSINSTEKNDQTAFLISFCVHVRLEDENMRKLIYF